MKLLIPGPVSTHPAVRAAMAQDIAPWDNDFRALVASVLDRVLALAGGRPGEHVALALQGCGHFALEAAVRSFVPAGGRVLVPMTGAYAQRLSRLAREAGREPVAMAVADGEPVDPAALQAALEADRTLGHAALVYSETGTGLCHDVPALLDAVARTGRRAIVDAVSALGALPFDLKSHPAADSVSFTANKCVEGLAGVSFTVCNAERLRAGAGRAGSWSFDLADIQALASRNGAGASRFTPSAQAIAAFSVALDLHDAEGRARRLARYAANRDVVFEGVRTLGLRPFLRRDVQGPIVVNVRAPDHPAWLLQRFVDALKRRGFVISNFVNTADPGFRVGCIGALSPDDMREAVAAMGESLAELGLPRTM